MSTFYCDATKQIGVAESVLHKLYRKLGKKEPHAELTADLIENRGGNKPDLAKFVFDLVNVTLDCVKVIKSGCLEVDCLNSRGC